MPTMWCCCFRDYRRVKIDSPVTLRAVGSRPSQGTDVPCFDTGGPHFVKRRISVRLVLPLFVRTAAAGTVQARSACHYASRRHAELHLGCMGLASWARQHLEHGLKLSCHAAPVCRPHMCRYDAVPHLAHA